MAEPFLGEIRLTSFAAAPRGWAACNGQLLQIGTNQALFSLLGTSYGGDGRTTFALPDLRGRAPLHFGGAVALGQAGGEAAHTLAAAELPPHNHLLLASSDLASTASPSNAVPAAKGRGGRDIYAAAGSPAAPLSPQALAPAGASQAHNNMQPYLTMNFIIATQGIFPSRN